MEIATLNNKKILITGGSGFIGTNLIDAVKMLPISILNLSRRKPRNPDHQKYFYSVDILDADSIVTIVRKFSPDYIIHLAAKTRYHNREDKEGFRINTEGTKNIIDAARKTSSVRRLILASSNVVNRADRFSGYTYSESKRIAESILHAEHDLHFQWCIVRPCHVWGPWFDAPFKDFFLMIARGRYVHPGTFDSLRFSGYVGNVVFQILRLLQTPEDLTHRQTFFLADYQPFTIRTWANMISQQFGKKNPPVMSNFFVRLAAISGDLFSLFGWKKFPITSERLHNMMIHDEDIPISKIETIAGTLPFTTSDGIHNTIHWLREQKAL